MIELYICSKEKVKDTNLETMKPLFKITIEDLA